jgi:K+-sensing histidine kinase KdpD
MSTNRFHFNIELLANCVLAALTVIGLTIPLMLIGRNILGEAVIALLYLIPVGWSAARWGQGPGICAAVVAALAFDFFFIPPFRTFSVGSLEGWLVLAIFLAVAIIVVGRIQAGISRAQASEREAVFMYELTKALAGLQTQEAVAHTLARHLQQMFQAELVEVFVQSGGAARPIGVSSPADGIAQGKPDVVLPVLARPGLVGEIRLWRGNGWLPSGETRLMKNIALQAAAALEHTHLFETEVHASLMGMQMN